MCLKPTLCFDWPFGAMQSERCDLGVICTRLSLSSWNIIWLRVCQNHNKSWGCYHLLWHTEARGRQGGEIWKCILRLYLRPGLDIMKGGNGSAALCSVSNWMWRYIIQFSSIHQLVCKTCLYGCVTGAAWLVMMPEQQLWGDFWLLLREAIHKILERRFLTSEHWLIGHNKCPAWLEELKRARKEGWDISELSKWLALLAHIGELCISARLAARLAQPSANPHLPFTSK